MKDLQAITDLRRIKEFQTKKLESSPSFKEFHDVFYSEETQDLFNKFLANKSISILKLLKNMVYHGLI